MLRLLAALLLLAAAALPETAEPAAAATTAEPPAGRGAWPTGRPVPVVRVFDPPAHPWLPGHRGVDLPASPGAAVHAPIAGTVVLAEVVVDRPVLVVARQGVRVSLEPVVCDVPVGTPVAVGEAIGRIADGPGHCAPDHCLHWGLRVDGTYHDPLLLVLAYRAVLLP